MTQIVRSSGMFSMNCNVPTNGKVPEDPLYIFGIIVAVAFVLVCVYSLFVRWVWKNAKKRSQKL